MELTSGNTKSVRSTSKPENVTIKNWHEVENIEITNLVKKKVSWDYIERNYKSPMWCKHPSPLMGVMGCDTLLDIDDRKSICEVYCSKCEYFIGTLDDYDIEPPKPEN